MGGQPAAWRRAVREAQFVVNMEAFMQYDFYVIDQAMRADISLTMPGRSRFAGTHVGVHAVGRCLAGLRHALRPLPQDVAFHHRGDRMTVSHGVIVVGPRRTAEMVIRTHVRYDRDNNRMVELEVEPEDLDLFDQVLDSERPESASAAG